MFFSISIPSLLAAAEFSSLGAGFPEGWVKAEEKTCTPKAGVEIKTTLYVQEVQTDLMKIVELLEKNGVVFFRLQALFSNTKRPVSLTVEIKKDDKIFTFVNEAAVSGPQLDALFLEAAGLTEKEFALCFK